MSSINRELLGRNIKYLSDRKNVKIGEVEAQAGVSVGYLSRIVKDSSSSNLPLLEVIMAFSEKLGVSMDSLLTVDFSKLSVNEKYLSDFCNSILEKTKSQKIQWHLESNGDKSERHSTNLLDKTFFLDQSCDDNGCQIISMSFQKDGQDVLICTVSESDELYPIMKETADNAALFTEKRHLNDEVKKFMSAVLKEDILQDEFLKLYQDFFNEVNKLEQRYGTGERLAKTLVESQNNNNFMTPMLIKENYSKHMREEEKILAKEIVSLKKTIKSISSELNAKEKDELEMEICRLQEILESGRQYYMSYLYEQQINEYHKSLENDFDQNFTNNECANQIVKVEEIFNRLLTLYGESIPNDILIEKMKKATDKMEEIRKYTADIIADLRKKEQNKQ